VYKRQKEIFEDLRRGKLVGINILHRFHVVNRHAIGNGTVRPEHESVPTEPLGPCISPYRTEVGMNLAIVFPRRSGVNRLI